VGSVAHLELLPKSSLEPSVLSVDFLNPRTVCSSLNSPGRLGRAISFRIQGSAHLLEFCPRFPGEFASFSLIPQALFYQISFPSLNPCPVTVGIVAESPVVGGYLLMLWSVLRPAGNWFPPKRKRRRSRFPSPCVSLAFSRVHS